MRYTPKQAKQINKGSIKLAQQISKTLQTYLRINLNMARQYDGSVGKLPYVDKFGNLTYLDPTKLLIIHYVSKISPETARRLTKHRPVIEAILAGKSPETIERLKNSL